MCPFDPTSASRHLEIFTNISKCYHHIPAIQSHAEHNQRAEFHTYSTYGYIGNHINRTVGDNDDNNGGDAVYHPSHKRTYTHTQAASQSHHTCTLSSYKYVFRYKRMWGYNVHTICWSLVARCHFILINKGRTRFPSRDLMNQLIDIVMLVKFE
uniref:Uncharacterized protein n=1 Tax=Glossina pallidipes TaxID=7398 RepID=A0A1A9ZG06_GLOPL